MFSVVKSFYEMLIQLKGRTSASKHIYIDIIVIHPKGFEYQIAE